MILCFICFIWFIVALPCAAFRALLTWWSWIIRITALTLILRLSKFICAVFPLRPKKIIQLALISFFGWTEVWYFEGRLVDLSNYWPSFKKLRMQIPGKIWNKWRFPNISYFRTEPFWVFQISELNQPSTECFKLWGRATIKAALRFQSVALIEI